MHIKRDIRCFYFACKSLDVCSEPCQPPGIDHRRSRPSTPRRCAIALRKYLTNPSRRAISAPVVATLGIPAHATICFASHRFFPLLRRAGVIRPPVEVGVRPLREATLLDRRTVSASIVWGLTFSIVLTLFEIPVPYRFFMGDRTGGRADRASG